MKANKMKHPHHDIIIAWLNGEQIQREEASGVWNTINHVSVDSTLPSFFSHVQYRIKPANIVVRKHIAYHCYNGDNCWTPDTKEPNFEFEFDPDTKKLVSCKIIEG